MVHSFRGATTGASICVVTAGKNRTKRKLRRTRILFGMQICRPWDEVRRDYERIVNSMRKPYATAAHAERDRRFIIERFTEGEGVARLLMERLGAARPL